MNVTHRRIKDARNASYETLELKRVRIQGQFETEKNNMLRSSLKSQLSIVEAELKSRRTTKGAGE